jgi:hypothetical protein
MPASRALEGVSIPQVVSYTERKVSPIGPRVHSPGAECFYGTKLTCLVAESILASNGRRGIREDLHFHNLPPGYKPRSARSVRPHRGKER